MWNPQKLDTVRGQQIQPLKATNQSAENLRKTTLSQTDPTALLFHEMEIRFDEVGPLKNV